MNVNGKAVFNANCKVGNNVNVTGNFVVEEGGQVGDDVDVNGTIQVGKFGCVPANLEIHDGVKVPTFGSLKENDNGKVVVLKAIAGKMYVLRSGKCVLSVRYDAHNLVGAGI